MADESKIDDPASKRKAAAEVIEESQASNAHVESENEEEEDDVPAAETAASGAATRKKKSKKKRLKKALGIGPSEASASDAREDINKAVSGLSKSQLNEILSLNPALAEQLGVTDGKDLTSKQATDALKKLSLEDIMTGLASKGKNVKDMGSYKFWQTQPVPKFGETSQIEEGPFKMIDIDQVPKEPGPLVDGFEWVTMDLTNEDEIKEVYELLNGHYVEDNESMFRFNYSVSFLKW